MGYAFVSVDPKNLTLIPNFDEKKTSSELMQEHSCVSGVNGGFYDANNRPLGLFMSDGVTLREKSENALINGFVGVTNQNMTFISNEIGPDMRFIMQTGPFLLSNGLPHTLAIKNDEHARRLIVAQSTDGDFIFIALYDPDNTFNGPLLGDLPLFISEINRIELLNITEAINLDGGSASAFYNGDTTLSELTSIGSFFCVQ